jgi:hypothetical protein
MMQGKTIMNKLKAMWNNSYAKFCGFHAAAYLATTGTANARTNVDLPDNPFDQMSSDNAMPSFSGAGANSGNSGSSFLSQEAIENIQYGAVTAVGIAANYAISYYSSKKVAQNGGSAKKAALFSILCSAIPVTATVNEATKIYGWKGGAAAAALQAGSVIVGTACGIASGREEYRRNIATSNQR